MYLSPIGYILLNYIQYSVKPKIDISTMSVYNSVICSYVDLCNKHKELFHHHEIPLCYSL